MNCSVYLFGDFGNGLRQYPIDFTATFLEKCIEMKDSGSQVVLYRDKDIVYHSYLRKLDNKQYIGFCIIVNGVYFSKIGKLFPIFEKVITDMVYNGAIIGLNDNGDIVSKVNDFIGLNEETERICNNIKLEINSLDAFCRPLPPTNYSVAKGSVTYISVRDDISDVPALLSKADIVCISKDFGYNTNSLTGYKGVVANLQNQINDSTEKYNELQNKYNELVREKKQLSYVIWLFVILVLLGVALFFIIGNLRSTERVLSETQESLLQANTNLIAKGIYIDSLNAVVGDLKESLNKERKLKIKAENNYSELKNSVASLTPILINNVKLANTDNSGKIETDYGGILLSSEMMCLKPKIYYTSITPSKELTLTLKFYTPSGLSKPKDSISDYSYKQSFVVSANQIDSIEINSWGGNTKGIWSKGAYRIEFWNENVLLYVKRFTIY